ncbi:MAG TPA: type II toxin-antitoxin system PemK/MazF family toxin [Atopostipes sp.]|nr:type II toxin-antitoxin system PemK/MazF family toxin [Atopostipes sp.]
MIKRGEVYYADLSPVVGSEQGGVRPVLILQNNVGNKYSPTVIVAAITSKIDKSRVPTHVAIGKDKGLTDDSVALLEQIRTIDKQRLTDKITHLNDDIMKEVDKALKISIGIT